jgi:hypothetical protein
VSDLDRKPDQVADAQGEFVDELGGVHGDHLLAQDGAVVVGAKHHHTVEERLQVQFFE